MLIICLTQSCKQLYVLHDAWENFQDRGFGFPRFKKFGLHRPIPDGFVVKQVRVLSKAREHNGMNHHPVSGICPFHPVHGRAVGIDLGLEWFLRVSDGSWLSVPSF